jgi:hypothetical protein
MIQPQELPKYAPYFGSPKALRRQNQQLTTLFSAGAMSPVDAAEVLDRFWQIYDSAVEPMNSELKRTEIGKLTWCFALEQNGRRIIDDVNVTFFLLALIQERYHHSYLHGLRYSFFHGYKPGSTAFKVFRAALRQMLAKLDWSKLHNQQWRFLSDILPTKSHLVLARWVIVDDIPFFFDQIAFDQIAANQEWKTFWLEYLDSVGNGTNERAKRLPGQGRYAELTDGNARQNALILKIEELVIVEFSGGQNLRYVYDERFIPFALNAPSYQMSELCHPGALFKQHLKKGWQAEFAVMLHDHFGIYRHQLRRHQATQQHHQQV